MSNVERIVKQAVLTFKKGNAFKFQDNYAKLISLTNRLILNDLKVDKRFVNSHDTSDSRDRMNPVMFINIFKDNNVHITMFILKSASKLPLHDHPMMYGILKVLYGSIHLQSYSINSKNIKTSAMEPIVIDPLFNNGEIRREITSDVQSGILQDNEEDYDESNNSKKSFYPYNGIPLRAISAPPVMVGKNDECVTVTPYDNNLHEIRSVDGPAVFLDILSPPYRTSLFNVSGAIRECTYFRQYKDPSLNENECLLLSCYPDDYWCVEAPYNGPSINLNS